jgi:hypothetical protein
MQELIVILKILGIGLGGILMMCFIKINDITQVNPNLNFWAVSRLFFSKAASSYIASIIAVFLYALSRDEWPKLFVTGNVTPGFVERLLGLQILMSFFVGTGMQFGIYKLFLKKVDNIMKIWAGNIKYGGPDESTPQPKIKEDGTLELPSSNKD